ncbi:MAG: hypothetical protein D9V47_06115 [Clostridia bacterium]|nr:MAG: hypothetical protein D9V47_06115 [Clostridia bacterium]
MARKHSTSSDDIRDSVGLLISILIRYPEVGSINYEPTDHLLKFTFMVGRIIAPDEWLSFRETVTGCIAAMNFLEQQEAEVASIDYSTYEGISMIEVKRDVTTFRQDELVVITGVLKESFGQDILAEGDDEHLLEEDLLAQEELIGHMLENVKGAVPDKRLIAFREAGRVLVFNK